jgi:hypothetical protein
MIIEAWQQWRCTRRGHSTHGQHAGPARCDGADVEGHKPCRRLPTLLETALQAGTQQMCAERSLRHWRHPRVLGVAES